MRSYTESSIFQKMNQNNGIYNQIVYFVKSVTPESIVNAKLASALNDMGKAYKDTLTYNTIKAITDLKIILVAPTIDKRLPAGIPYVKTKRKGEDCVIVDLGNYARVTRDSNGAVTEASIDISKLYNLCIPAFISLNVLNNENVVSNETVKWMAYMWALLFNKVLMSQRCFVGNQERYEAFMYFAMRFFMIHYMETPLPIVDDISLNYINKTKSNYILMIENNLKAKQLNLYESWDTFAYLMFSNEITNIQMATNTVVNAESYLRLFSSIMGKDGAYLALWSADYFFYCLFITYNHAYILNDKAWADVVEKNKKAMPRVLAGLYKEL